MKEKTYTVAYWVNTEDGYDNREKEVIAQSEDEALEKVMLSIPRGKDFKLL